MIAYADTSAVVKRYLEEDGSDLVLALEGFMTSTLTAVETCSAIWRLVRMGELEPGDARWLAGRATSDLTGGEPAVITVPPTNEILASASALTGSAGLRAYDAVHLASAIVLREVYPDVNTFACFDRTLAAAAAAHGFDLLA